jgi:hypothetical protein
MAGIVGSLSGAGDAERLTGVAAVEHIDPRRRGVHLAYVGVDGDSGPVALEDGSAVLVVLAEPRGWDADSEVDSANAAEQ